MTYTTCSSGSSGDGSCSCFAGYYGPSCDPGISPGCLFLPLNIHSILVTIPPIVYCTKWSDSAASWTQTLSGTYANFTCASGHSASTTAVFCAQNGATASWGANPCQSAYCAAGSSDSASWPQTQAETVGVYNCTSGYYASNPRVPCVLNGVTASWGPNPCQPVYCSASSSATMRWEQTLAGTSTTLNCLPGFYSSGPCTSVYCVQNGGSAYWATTTLSCQS